MNQRGAGLVDYFSGNRFARLFGRFTKNNVRTVTLYCANLHPRRIRWHNDVRRNAAQFRRARHCGTVIAGRMRCDTASRGDIVQRKYCVGRAARFERTDLLKIFAFKEQSRGRGTRLVQSLACQHWGAMNVRTNPLMRRADAIEIKRHCSLSQWPTAPLLLETRETA